MKVLRTPIVSALVLGFVAPLAILFCSAAQANTQSELEAIRKRGGADLQRQLERERNTRQRAEPAAPAQVRKAPVKTAPAKKGKK